MIVRKFQVLITCPNDSMSIDDAVSFAENEVEKIENEMLFQGQEMLGLSALPKGWEINSKTLLGGMNQPEQFEKWDYIRSSRLPKIANIRRMAEEDGTLGDLEVWESRYSQDVPFLMALVDEMRQELALTTHALAVDTDLLKTYRGAYGIDHRNQDLAVSLDRQNEDAVKLSEAVITRVIDGNHYRYDVKGCTLSIDIIDRWQEATATPAVVFSPLDGLRHTEAWEQIQQSAQAAPSEGQGQ